MKIAEVDLLKESTYQTPCGTIHYWSSILSLDTTTLVFLPGLTADHRLFDKQVAYFDGKYNIIVWDAPAHASSWPFRKEFDMYFPSTNPPPQFSFFSVTQTEKL